MIILTCVLKVQVKEFKIKFKNKFYIEKIIFKTFKILNVQFLRNNFYIWFLNLSQKHKLAFPNVNMSLYRNILFLILMEILLMQYERNNNIGFNSRDVGPIVNFVSQAIYAYM